MSEDTLSIRLDDEGTPQTAEQSASALEFLIKTIERFGKTEVDGAMPTRVLERLGVAGKQAGSALAAGMSGTLDMMLRVAEGEKKLSSVEQLLANRIKERGAAAARANKEMEMRANVLPTALQPGAAPKAPGGFQQLVGIVGKIFGPQAAGGLTSGAARLAEASDKLGPWMPLLEKGGGLLMGGGKIVAGAAIGLTLAAGALVVAAGAAAYKLLHAGAELAIKSTTFREDTESALDAVLKSADAAQKTYQAGIKVAVELGLNKEDTLARVKSLVTSGFRDEEITVIIRAVADVKAAKSEGAGDALQKVLEKIKTSGEFKSLDELKEAGIQSDLVLANLAKKLGVSVETVKSKLKAGQISAAEGIKAILAAVNEQTGGAAEKASKSLPALAESAKTLWESLFDKVDLGPLKDGLGMLKSHLSGPEGDALKAAASNLFGTLFKTIMAPFQGPEGEKRLSRFLTSLTDGMNGAAIIVGKAGPIIISIVDGISKVLDRRGSTTGGSWIQSILMGLAELSATLTGIDITGLLEGAFAGFDRIQKWVDKLYLLGADLTRGLINGIMSGSGGVVGALVGIVGGAVAAAAGPKGADAHSPSRKTGQIGDWMGEGLVVNVMAWRDRAANAGSSVADRAAGAMGRAANDNAASVAPSSGGGGTSNTTIVVQIQMGPATGGATTDVQAVKQAAEEGAYLGWQKAMGRFSRGELKRVGT